TGPGATQQLVVLARYSDGTTEDVTDRCLFSSSDNGVAQVNSSGMATAVGQGETPVMVRCGGRVAVAVIGATTQPPQPATAYPDIRSEHRTTQRVRDTEPPRAYPTSNPVDECVYPKLRALHIRPSPLCSDEAFLRRAYLDLI